MADTIQLGVVLKADGSGLVGEVRVSQRELDKLGREAREAGQEADRSGRRFSGAGRQLQTLRNRARGALGTVKRLTTGFIGLNGILAGLSLGVFTAGVVDAGQAMEKFTQLLPAQELQFVRDEADRLGLSLKGTANDYVSLTAAAEGTNLEGAKTREIFSAVAEAGTVLRLSAEQQTGTFRALEQMISKGTVQAEELRGQLGERLPGAFQIAARAMGKTTVELNDMLDRGEVLASELLPKLAVELRKKFGGDLPEAVNGSVAAFNRFSTAWFNLQAAVAQSGVLDAIRIIVEEITDLMEDGQDDAREWGEAIVQASGTAIVALGHVGDFLDTVRNGIDSLRISAITLEQVFINLQSLDAKAKHFATGGFLSKDATRELERTLLENEQKLAELRSEAHGLAADIIERGTRDLSAEAEQLASDFLGKVDAALQGYKDRTNEAARSSREAAIAAQYMGDTAAAGADKGGEAAKEAGVDWSLLNQRIGDTTLTAREAAIAQNNLADEINATREEALQAARDLESAHENEMDVLRARMQGGERAAEIERRWQEAQADSVKVSREQVAAWVDAERQLRSYVEASEAAAERWSDIWRSAVGEFSSGIGEAFADEVIREEQAKDRAKRQLDERLEDLREQLEAGTISHEEALEQRKEAFEDHADRMDEINQSMWERMGDVAVDTFANTIERMMSAWIESGITELIASAFDDEPGISFGGFSLDNVFGFGGSASSSSGAGGGGAAAAGAGSAASGAQTFALGESAGTTTTATSLGSGSIATGAGVTTLGGANTVAGVGGGISGASVTGGSAGAGLGGGTAAGGSAGAGAGMAAAGYAAAVLAIPFIGKALAGKTNRAQFLNDFAGFNEGMGGLGLQVGTGKKDRHGFFAGPNAGFAADFIGRQAGAGATFSANREGTFGFTQGFQGEGLLEMLRQAEAEFERVSDAGAQAFNESSQSIAEALQDGVIDETEKAARGIEKLGDAFVHPKTGAIEYKDVTAEQFAQVADAINSGELRLRALQDETIRTADESRVLGEIFSDALNGAADSARGLADEIRGIPSEKTITIHERRVSTAIERRHGTGGAPSPQRSLAEGGIITRPTLIEAGERGHEAYVPLSGGRIPVDVRGAGSDRATLREMSAMREDLRRIERAIVTDGPAAVATAIAEPMAKMQRRDARARDRRGRRR